MTEDELRRALRFFMAAKLAGAGFPKHIDPETAKEWVREFLDMNEHEPHIRVLGDVETGELFVTLEFD